MGQMFHFMMVYHGTTVYKNVKLGRGEFNYRLFAGAI